MMALPSATASSRASVLAVALVVVVCVSPVVAIAGSYYLVKLVDHLPRLARRIVSWFRGIPEFLRLTLEGVAYLGMDISVDIGLARTKRLVRLMEPRAVLRQADGTRGRRARRALRVLARRGRSYPAPRDALWRVWLDNPDDEVTELLPESWPGRAFAAGTDPAQPAAKRAQIGAFCAVRGLAPQEASQRALFFVLTGQRAQHRTEDPDGALLAEAYRAGRDEQRAAVRQALAGADDLDLVRVVAGAGRDAAATVTPAEVSYLADELAARQDWTRLWKFALDLPLAGVVIAASRFGDSWQPDDDAGQALLHQLATTGGGHIEPGLAAELIGRPLALLTPADLVAVASLLKTQPSEPLTLLAACLEYRFGHEIALGEQVPVTPGSPDDVAVTPSPAPQVPADT